MRYKWILFILGCFLALNAQADISVSPIVVDLIGKDKDAEIAVKNDDTKNNMYVEVTPYRLLNPSNHSAPKKKIFNPETDGLLVFPLKLLILPGQTQFVRIIRTAKSLASDQVYEVDFVPKVSTHLISQTDLNGVTLGVRVIIGYGARVTLRPDSPVPSFSAKRMNNQLMIKNTGNTLLNITGCTQLISNQKTEIALPAYTLYVGQTVTKELTQSTPVIVTASFIGKPLDPIYTQ
jgi:P pilus assembly chaperone PapD